MEHKFEWKLIGFGEIKLAGADEPNPGRFSGYASVFNEVDLGGDMILPGAFAEAVAAANRKNNPQFPRMHLQHALGWTNNDMLPIGVWTALEEDSKGLRVEGQLAPTSTARDVHALLTMQPRPALDGLSIGYVARKATWPKNPKPGEPTRIISKLDLLEISVVVTPMDPRARIVSAKGDLSERARAGLRFAGFEDQEAATIASAGLKALAGHVDPNPNDPSRARREALAAALRSA